jgi:peptidoglycan/xylan/chitin deacetylase (PgdA/CDA1 family)/spore germination protein YaaH
MSPMSTQAVFFDPTGRRRRRFALAVSAFVLLVLIAGGLFASTLIAVAPAPSLPFAVERVAPPPTHLAHKAARLAKKLVRKGAWLVTGRHTTAPEITTGFYVPWEETSIAALQRHVDDLDWVVPGWLEVLGPNHQLQIDPDPQGRAIIAAASHRPKVLPMLQNAQGGVWYGQDAAALLHSAPARAHLLDQLEALIARGRWDGLFFDLEGMPPSAPPDYLQFLKEAHVRFARHGWLLAVAAPVGDAHWNPSSFAAVADRLFLMLYDEHWPEGEPGPIASQGWYVDMLGQALAHVPLDKVAVSIGSYAYDWPDQGTADPQTIEEALLSAHDSDTVPTFDPVSGNTTFDYAEQGITHRVWMLDAASVSNQLKAARAMGVSAFGLWRLGSEDPSVWQIFGRSHRTSADPHVIESIPAGTNVDMQGTGEILRIDALPVAGSRSVSVDRNGLVTGETYTRLPLPYAIERSGYRPGLVALTFDDGPDPAWTPQILDILKSRHVPATFFIVGENALGQRSLLQRELAEGHEIGNHSYTHPNLGMARPWQTELELNATQRLFQAYTGRTLTLFRAPYFGDAEPTTADEIGPAYTARQLGYLSVGLHVDPGDWKRPGVQEIIDRTIAQVRASSPDRSGNIVLLHDSGGDRSQTIAALPAIIDRLQALGYRFVTVSQLIGVPASQAMPTLTAGEHLAAQTDFAFFMTLHWLSMCLWALFAIAITLGIGRAVILSALALRQARRDSRIPNPPLGAGRFVSVLIPCFNEAAVIEASVRRVLASTAVRLEVIVIDDGSSDGTGDIVERAFGADPRVQLLRLPNGGKARALNRALECVSGDYVVALDADTQFEPKTIARLVRWFDDPTIGAVAGNAKVGNRVNLVTRWQALEYVTAQNLERRALAALNAITVVPGAVGAWRTAALREVGGYPPDTLAEDQDLTIAIQRIGWAVHYDRAAIAYTEAPENFAGLAKQRFRWAFGTVQCLWKHRAIVRAGQPRGLAWIGLPQAVVFQLCFAAISPIIDLALIITAAETAIRVAEHGWAAAQDDLFITGAYWLCFMAIDLLAGVIAFALERREQWRLLWLLLPQRIGYRQIIYWVVIKALVQALRGPRVGWGKLERTGRVLPA